MNSFSAVPAKTRLLASLIVTNTENGDRAKIKTETGLSLYLTATAFYLVFCTRKRISTKLDIVCVVNINLRDFITPKADTLQKPYQSLSSPPTNTTAHSTTKQCRGNLFGLTSTIQSQCSISILFNEAIYRER